jgi:hypothetical protein
MDDAVAIIYFPNISPMDWILVLAHISNETLDITEDEHNYVLYFHDISDVSHFSQ